MLIGSGKPNPRQRGDLFYINYLPDAQFKLTAVLQTFFLAVNQLNSGDGCSLSDPSKRLMFATLNLKAGRRAIDLCDYNSALKLLESGMSLLPDDHWKSEYNLSLQMYRVAVDTACTLNNAAAVTKFSQEILTNVEAPLEKLHALFCVMKCLRTASKIQESQQLSYSILQQLGESLPRERGDSDLLAEIDSMRTKVLNMPDESIINMKESTRKEKDMLLLGLYSNLIVVMNDQNPKRMDDICLRMMEITVVNGLCALSPLSVALFALVLVSTGDIELAYRLGRLALRLTEKANGQRFLSEVAFFVGGCVSWVSEPLQSVAETNLLGYTNGQQVGDVLSALSNYQFYSLAIYLSGKNLKFCRDTSRKVSESLMQRHYLFLYKQAVVVYRQTAAFIGDVEGEEERPGNFPSWDDLMTHPERSANIDFSFYIQAHLYMRIFILTRDFTNLPNEGLLVRLTRKQTPMRPILWVGVFFEGLVSFHLARLLDDSDYYQQGEAALAFISKWRNSCNNKCNFENKYMVLEAMRLDLKDPDQAEDFYLKAVKSSKENRFVHEEGIASELSGDFYHRRGNIAKSYSFYRNAMECYGTWGANAVTQRLKEDVLEKFDSRQIIAQPIEKYISAVGYGEEPISTTRKRAE
ncbi:hypothetical protein THAOC_11316 [Thalassiosira oceanica]|uniref:Uncharacterized protein n=1 Tax=Thalassiosira oceanica TaxID=159749 RepID=K0T2V3_THAOC|nr:hypothetical protein THAOC_11316 [Thalassiosira oceanica]|eukprot:EJK67626.1 hypothetical protein THAOC_11316 [Thalassiosira oceanica]